MEYTVFKVTNHFLRNSDAKLTQMKVNPIDARGYPGNYQDPANPSPPGTMRQTYGGTGAPTNMQIYHSWIDAMAYQEPAPNQALVSFSTVGGYTGRMPLALGPGEYRLRVDTLEYDGSNPPGNSQAHKAFAVRATDAGGVNPCAQCTLAAMSDMAIFTPIAATTANASRLPLFQLPPDYAGKTINVDIFDPGDVSGGGILYLGIIDPTTNLLLTAPAANPVKIYNLFQQRSNCCAGASALLATTTVAEQLITDSGGRYLDNYWIHYEIPIPTGYAPGTDPNNWWFQLQYRTIGTVTATDTITIAISLKGAPTHLIYP